MIDTQFMILRAAGDAGDLDAAREHARLAALLREEEVAEERLRALVERLPHDSAAAHLLIAELLRAVVAIREDFSYRPNQPQPELDRVSEEIAELCQALRLRDPADGVAQACLAALRELLDEEGRPHVAPAYEHSWYVVERETAGGSVEFRQRLVVTDADELRWACDRWAADEEGYWDQGCLTLRVYRSGVAAERIDLGDHSGEYATDWDAVEIPPLSGTPLPPGQPVRIEDGELAHHGFVEHVS
ncbi:hypothetical protein OHA77_00245 [Streptosporangium sp. NBC_01639]|uniref:hypothetical protein n=1 Tax=Streptosporangium sp. NBC_01639 TaxID=2975948 RepID=UPI00386616D3|nr:hypothetical protein OHA77_00245 [Streptosporangium sp. NBC_01639]